MHDGDIFMRTPIGSWCIHDNEADYLIPERVPVFATVADAIAYAYVNSAFDSYALDDVIQREKALEMIWKQLDRNQ